jgi:hypothetical protein
MMLQLADNNSMTMLPGIDATTGEIVQINPEMFLALSRADQEEFMRDLPTALEALDRGMGADGRIFNKYKDAVKNFVSEVRQKDKIVRESDIENIRSLPAVTPGVVRQNLTPGVVMPADKMVSRPPAQAPDPNASLFVGVDPTFSPWFTKPPVLIAGGVLVLGTIYLLTRK